MRTIETISSKLFNTFNPYVSTGNININYSNDSLNGGVVMKISRNVSGHDHPIPLAEIKMTNSAEAISEHDKLLKYSDSLSDLCQSSTVNQSNELSVKVNSLFEKLSVLKRFDDMDCLVLEKNEENYEGINGSHLWCEMVLSALRLDYDEHLNYELFINSNTSNGFLNQYAKQELVILIKTNKDHQFGVSTILVKVKLNTSYDDSTHGDGIEYNKFYDAIRALNW